MSYVCTSAPQALRAIALLTLIAASACAESLSLEVPGDDVLFYQPRAVTSLDNNTVYVVSTNYDKRFSAGWLSSIDVAGVVQALETNTSAAKAVTRTLLVPRMGGRLVFDTNTGNGNDRRAFLPHLGAGLLTVIDMKAGEQGFTLSCGDTGDRSDLPTDLVNTSCDRFHMVDLMDQAWSQDTRRKRSDFMDPAAVAYLPPYNGTPETLLVGYLGVSWVTPMSLTTSADPASSRVAAANLSGNIFASALTSMRHLLPSAVDGSISYAAGSGGTGAFLVPLVFSSAGFGQQPWLDFSTSTGGGVIERSLISPVDPTTIYALNRAPDQVVTVKRKSQPSGLAVAGANLEPAEVLQLQPQVVSIDGSQPFDMVYAQRSTGSAGGLGDIVAVVGVAKNTVYFLQPTPTGLHLVGRLPLESDVILTSATPALAGGGPGGITYIDARSYGSSTYTDLLFVSNFYSHTLSVIDISSANASAFKEVLRIEGNDLGPSLRYP